MKIEEMLKENAIETVLFGAVFFVLGIVLPMIPGVAAFVVLPTFGIANLFNWLGLFVAVIVKNLAAGFVEKAL